jgi:ssDNA-binding Zn-finger/Zn-ribbon topoisomerase 1
MPNWILWVVPLAVGVGGAFVVVQLALHQRGPRSGRRGSRSGTIDLPCSVCQKELVFTSSELTKLSGAEVALVVRSVPRARTRSVAEYVCPHCEASHYFLVDGAKPEWIGANLYTPETKTGRCQQCRKALHAPAWGQGQYDGRLKEAPFLRPDYGLVCPFCKSVICVECAERTSHNRTADGALICPRCHRQPVDRVFHP